MAKQPNNIVMKSTQGIFGGQVVFKIRAGKPYVAAPPQVKEDRILKPGEQERRDKFALAIKYSQAAVEDPAIEAAYAAAAKPGQSAANVAFVDFYKAPVVSLVNKENYRGLATDTISIQATDNFKVARVKVSIHTAAGELVEEGDAVAEAGTLNWLYTVSGENEEAIGSTIKATAYDLPGNEGSLEITV